MTENTDHDKDGVAKKRFSFSRFERLGRLLLEAASVILTLAVVWLGSLGTLMNREKVDLAFFKPHYEQWFSRAFDGHAADIETYEARWIDNRQSVEFTVENIEIEGENDVSENITLVVGEFALAEPFWAEPSLTRLSIDGGAITVARDNQGVVQVGLGTPVTFQNVGAIWSSDATKRTASDKTSTRKPWAELRNINVKSAKIYVQDEMNGFDVVLEDIDGTLTYDGEFIDLLGAGHVVTDQNRSPFTTHMITTLDRRNFAADLKIEKLNPLSIAPKLGQLSVLGNLDAPVDLELNMTFVPERGVEDLFVDFAAGEGTLKTGTTYKPFQQAKLKASYNADAEHIEVSDLQIESEALNISALGNLDNLGSPETGFLKQPFNYRFDVGPSRLNPGQKFDGAIRLKTGVAEGSVDLTNRDFVFDTLEMDFGDFQAEFSGSLRRGAELDFENIEANGTINGEMKPEQLLSFWPNNFALGARNWIEKSIKSGVLTNFVIDVAIDAEDIRQGQIENEHLNLAFDVERADVRFMRQMPWLRGVSGSGVLQGNRADFKLDTGHVDELIIDTGVVTIPRLAPHGGDFTIDMEGRGTTQEMLRITNFPPFEFAKQFGVAPSGFGGEGVIKMNVTRPLLEFFDQSRILYDLSGEFTNVSLPVNIGKLSLNSGEMTLVANKDGISIDGPIKVGSWPTHLNWQKKLGVEAQPAKYDLSGRVGRDDLDAFGIGLRRHFGGEVSLTLSGEGDGISVQTIDVEADFIDADLNIGSLWAKQKGEPGSARGQLVLQGDAGNKLQNISLKAKNLDIVGELALAQDFRLENLSVPSAKIDGFIDASVQAKPTEDGVLSMFLTGEYLNIEPWVNRAFSTQSSAVSAPLRLTAALKKLSLDENYHLNDASALFSTDGQTTQSARLKGTAKTGPFIAEITRGNENNSRNVHVKIPDAGFAILTLLGMDSVRGGALQIDGKLPPVGEAGGVNGTIEMTDFTLVRAPVFTQILSLASLTGLADTLSGGGLNFTNMTTRFALEDGVFKVRDARASGPALGLTAAGDIGLREKTLDMDGVLVPSYSVNSILGGVPLLGDIIVGKKGEGLFALNYGIKGPFSATQVSVNPLSALTPGFLRRIFDVQRDDIADPNVKELIEEQKQE